MEFDILILLLCVVSNTHSAKSASKPSVAKSAIIAIEIVDPDEKPGTKNSKRTIESSLGYGYQDNSFGHGRVPPPKYQIYKYSQHDIPPYRGPTRNIGHQVSPSRYQPGTTVYSTINQDGQVGTLSSQVPTQLSQGNVAIPVIILRVLPSQLASPSEHLFANIPQSNYLAPAVNSIDIKALLNRYLSQIGTATAYSAPQYQPEVPVQYYRQEQPAYQQEYYRGYQQMIPVYQEQAQQTQGYHQGYQQEPAQHQTPVYQQEPPQQQSSAYQPTQHPSPAYEQEPTQSYQQEPAQYQGMQYLPASQEKTNDLLTYENYPAKTHTRVVFRTPEGHVKTSSKSNVEDHQQNYSQEPSQELDYAQYQDYDNNADYNEQQPEQYQQQQQQQQQPVEHKQYEYGQNEAAASQNIIYVADKDETDQEEEKEES